MPRLLNILFCCVGREAHEITLPSQPILDMRSGTGCILKAATAGFTVRPEVGQERNRGVKDDCKAFSLSSWRNGEPERVGLVKE